MNLLTNTHGWMQVEMVEGAKRIIRVICSPSLLPGIDPRHLQRYQQHPLASQKCPLSYKL